EGASGGINRGPETHRSTIHEQKSPRTGMGCPDSFRDGSGRSRGDSRLFDGGRRSRARGRPCRRSGTQSLDGYRGEPGRVQRPDGTLNHAIPEIALAQTDRRADDAERWGEWTRIPSCHLARLNWDTPWRVGPVALGWHRAAGVAPHKES